MVSRRRGKSGRLLKREWARFEEASLRFAGTAPPVADLVAASRSGARRRLARARRPIWRRKATDGLRLARPQQLTRRRPARPRSAAATRCAPSRRTRASCDARAWIGAVGAVPASGGAEADRPLLFTRRLAQVAPCEEACGGACEERRRSGPLSLPSAVRSEGDGRSLPRASPAADAEAAGAPALDSGDEVRSQPPHARELVLRCWPAAACGPLSKWGQGLRPRANGAPSGRPAANS